MENTVHGDTFDPLNIIHHYNNFDWLHYCGTRDLLAMYYVGHS